MDESRRIPVSQRMWCATLHPHPSAPLPPTARTSRRLSDGAGPFGDPPGQGSRNRVRFGRSGADEVDPRREPSRSAQNHHQGPRSRTATSPDLPSALHQGLSHPRETRDRPWPNNTAFGPASSPAQRESRLETVGHCSPDRGHRPHHHVQTDHDDHHFRPPHGPGPPLPGGEPLSHPAPFRTGTPRHGNGPFLSPAAPHRRDPGPAGPHLGRTPGSALRLRKPPPPPRGRPRPWR